MTCSSLYVHITFRASPHLKQEISTQASSVQVGNHCNHLGTDSQESGTYFDFQTPEFGQNDTPLYFNRFSVFVKPKLHSKTSLIPDKK